MLHGTVSGQYTSDTGPRASDKLYATSMAMVIATRQTSWGKVQLKAMASLEPFMRHDGYARRYRLGPFEIAPGASVSAFAKPALFDTAYGRHPMGYTGFLRLSLGH